MVHFRGIEYGSPKECYEANREIAGAGLASFLNRLKAGWSVDDALLVRRAKKGVPLDESCTFRGIEYGSPKECYEANREIAGASLASFLNRLKAGWSVDDALLVRRAKKGVPLDESCTFRGIEYGSPKECYEANREIAVVGLASFIGKLKDGWSTEDALTKKRVFTVVGEHLVEGVVYKNLPSIAREYGLPETTIYKRYSRGFRGDDLVPKKKRKFYNEPEVEKKHRLVVRGVAYKSEAEACRKLGVKNVTYRHRRSRGHTIEQSLGLEPILKGVGKKAKTYEIDGEWLTVKDLANRYNVLVGTIRSRLLRGATVRQAVGIDPIEHGSIMTQSERTNVAKKRNKAAYIVDGVEYGTLKELAEAFNLKYYVVQQRISNYGYTPEEAVKSSGKSKPVVVGGVTYPSLTALAERYEITIENLLARLYSGFTLDEAVGLGDRITQNTVTFEGNTYPSLRALANKFGLSSATLASRMQRGFTLAEAIDAGPRINSVGRYNLKILERDEVLAAKPSYAYFVRIRIDGRDLYKIGITTKTVDERLKGEGHPYEMIRHVRASLIDCFKFEQEMLDLLSRERYLDVTGSELAGYTKVVELSEDEVDVVCSFFDDFNKRVL